MLNTVYKPILIHPKNALILFYNIYIKNTSCVEENVFLYEVIQILKKCLSQNLWMFPFFFIV